MNDSRVRLLLLRNNQESRDYGLILTHYLTEIRSLSGFMQPNFLPSLTFPRLISLGFRHSGGVL
jgi:hypothetical protein